MSGDAMSCRLRWRRSAPRYEQGRDENNGVKVDIPPDAVVIRFRPFTAEAVLASAAKEYRRAGHYRVSVFADARRPGEEESDVVARLMQVAGLSGIDVASNPRYMLCSSGEDITARGFEFHKDDEDDPDPVDEATEHYSVELGNEPTLEDAGRFLAPFRTVRSTQ
jgi:hypothetical protein